MPVKPVKRGDKFRLVEPGGKIAKNSSGTAIDGGGHSSRSQAQRQANAVNANSGKKKR